MRVAIDFSVYTQADGAFGNVTGSVSLIVLPEAGDSILFPFKEGEDSSLSGFSGILKVMHRVIPIDQENAQIMLALEDVEVPSVEDAMRLAKYLESAFDLFCVVYE